MGGHSRLTGRDSEQTQTMRLKLAKAVLDVATDNSRDVIALKNAALQKLAMDFRSGGAGAK